MKKINLFLSTLVIALVAFVVVGATIAPAVQINAMSLETAGMSTGELKGDLLFDQFGRYMINRNTLNESLYKDFQFFGYDWRLVKVEGNYATFWMSEPYTQSKFSHVEHSALGIYKDGYNIWTNGYSGTIWYDGNVPADKVLGQSDVRKTLIDLGSSILNNKKYASYKNKLVAGYIPGHNAENNDSAITTITNLAYAKYNENQVERVGTPTEQLNANWGLSSTEDYLWLPSVGDLRLWDLLVGNELNDAARWIATDNGACVWLRTAYQEDSYRALVLSADNTPNTTLDASGQVSEVASGDTYFYARAVGQNAGVRPAIHLNIQNINAEYEDHINNPNGKKSWWDDDWLKALFMTVCILGVIGLFMVVIAVIVKVRNAKQIQE